MNNIIKIILPGTPKSKDRSRMGHGRLYNPQSDLMNRVKIEIKNQLPEGFKAIKKNIPVSIDLSFYFIDNRKIKDEKLFHIKKPDVDNCTKFYLDCMNKIVFNDDNQVYSVNAVKFYSETKTPETIIYISY